MLTQAEGVKERGCDVKALKPKRTANTQNISIFNVYCNREPNTPVTLQKKKQRGEPQEGKAAHYELPWNRYLGIYLLQVLPAKLAAWE